MTGHQLLLSATIGAAHVMGHLAQRLWLWSRGRIRAKVIRERVP